MGWDFDGPSDRDLAEYVAEEEQRLRSMTFGQAVEPATVPELVRVVTFNNSADALAFAARDSPDAMKKVSVLAERRDRIPGSQLCLVGFVPSTRPSEFRLRVPPEIIEKENRVVREAVQSSPLFTSEPSKYARFRESLACFEQRNLNRFLFRVIAVVILLYLPFLLLAFHQIAPKRPSIDPYSILNLQHDASHTQIRSRYHELARKLHPDSHPSCTECTAKFANVIEAYHILSNETTREWYDQFGTLMPAPRETSRHSVRPTRLFFK